LQALVDAAVAGEAPGLETAGQGAGVVVGVALGGGAEACGGG